MKSRSVDGLTVRPATPDDAGLILWFVRQLADYEKLAHEVVATEAAFRQTLFSAKPAAEVLFAELHGEPVGFALFFATYSTFLARPGLYLEDLFVIPEARGKGIGKALLIYLAQEAKERGCGRFEWSVLDWNEPAIGFYRSLGAVAMDGWTVNRVSGDALARLASQDF